MKGGFGICVQECGHDGECKDGLVCCSNGCGMQCVEPVKMYAQCKDHDGCDDGDFCAVECFEGKCDGVETWDKGQVCQPCKHCTQGGDAVDGKCDVCKGDNDDCPNSPPKVGDKCEGELS